MARNRQPEHRIQLGAPTAFVTRDTRIGVWDRIDKRFVYRTTEARRAAAETRCSNLQAQYNRAIDAAYYGRNGRYKTGAPAKRYDVREVAP